MLFRSAFLPDGAILSVAGKINPAEIFEIVEKLFGSWKGKAQVLPDFGSYSDAGYAHEQKDSAQTQIALAYPSAKITDQEYYTAKVINSTLSGGMFGRLFIEVREKRGLCYSVYSRHSGTDRYGTTTCYAGTTPDRAQETLDVMRAELDRIYTTVTEEELERAKANILASVVMSEESPGSRAVSNAGDYAMLGRVRSLDEIQSGIEAVTCESIRQFGTKFPASSCAVQTLGPAALTVTTIN